MQLHLEIRDVVEILRTVAGLDRPWVVSCDLLCVKQASDDAVTAADPAREQATDHPDSARRNSK